MSTIDERFMEMEARSAAISFANQKAVDAALLAAQKALSASLLAAERALTPGASAPVCPPKVSMWCADCDQIVDRDRMDWTDDWCYRCDVCRRISK